MRYLKSSCENIAATKCLNLLKVRAVVVRKTWSTLSNSISPLEYTFFWNEGSSSMQFRRLVFSSTTHLKFFKIFPHVICTEHQLWANMRPSSYSFYIWWLHTFKENRFFLPTDLICNRRLAILTIQIMQLLVVFSNRAIYGFLSSGKLTIDRELTE